MPPNVVVLGHTGFIGGAIYRHLAEAGTPVRGLGSRDVDLSSPAGPERLRQVLDGTTTLVIAAARTPPLGATVEGFSENLTSIRRLAQAIELGPVRACVYFSSDGVYANSSDPVSENSPVSPVGFYPIAKYVGERTLTRVAEEHGFRLTILRSTAVFGPRDTHNAYGPNRFVRSIASERVVRLYGDGLERRDHIFVEDVAALTTELIRREATGVFNLATGMDRTFASIVYDLQEVAPAFEVVHEPPPTVTAQRSYDTAQRRYDISRLQSVVPEFSFTPFADALAVTLEHALISGSRRL